MKTAIIGGGVIGLSLAWELAGRGCEVTLIEKGSFGRKASWAGAGILLPENVNTAIHPIEQLTALSNELHAAWSKELERQTKIDNGFRRSGGLYVATSRGEAAALAGSVEFWREREIEVEPISKAEIRSRFPNVQLPDSDPFNAAWLPGESQICNPWHLKAIESACKLNGVNMIESFDQLEIETRDNQISAVRIDNKPVVADAFCFACGAWTEQVLQAIDVPLPMTPVKGQMVLFRADSPLDIPIINQGIQYLVPRSDGHVVAGATVEEVGFDEQTNEADLQELAELAMKFVPELNSAKIVKSWAGLRPGTYDGFPYLGKLSGFENGFVATGHFKTGLQLSTATAKVMADLIESKNPEIDLTPFAPSRVTADE
jgi:glycine oxidase